jgi:hypothetical protein
MEVERRDLNVNVLVHPAEQGLELGSFSLSPLVFDNQEILVLCSALLCRRHELQGGLAWLLEEQFE